MATIPSGARLTPARISQPTGSVSVSFTSVNTFTTPVNFGVTFAAAPRVVVYIASAAGATVGWDARAVSVTTTGFSLELRAGDGATDTWSGVPVVWIAIPA